MNTRLLFGLFALVAACSDAPTQAGDDSGVVDGKDAAGQTPDAGTKSDGGGKGSDSGGSIGAAGLHVVGNKLQDEKGNEVRLLGVNRSGTEYACIQGWGIFDGPSDAASVQAMAAWKIRSVRVLLNEDCWLGINGVPSSYGGAAYKKAITDYVALLHQNGMYAELSLIWTAPGTTKASDQGEMPDRDHSIDFWKDAATTFKNDPNVVFGVFGEPHNVDWTCWKNGGTGCGVGYDAASMQDLVDAVRSTGATQVISVPGIDFANNLTQWLADEPNDPLGQLIAEAHVYGGNSCQDTTCWNSQLAPVAAKVPLLTGEMGGDYQGTDCSGAFTKTYTGWADPLGVSYQLWTWDTWGNCDSAISTYAGKAYGNGIFFQQHLGAL